MLAAGLDDFLRKPYRPREIFDFMARHLGVHYLYGPRPQAGIAHSPIMLRPEDLAAIPAALLDETEKALISLDRERIELLVNQVTEQNALVGAVLAHLTDRYSYSPILRALQDCKRRFRQAEA